MLIIGVAITIFNDITEAKLIENSKVQTQLTFVFVPMRSLTFVNVFQCFVVLLVDKW
jgi:hypothetical protein